MPLLARTQTKGLVLHSVQYVVDSSLTFVVGLWALCQAFFVELWQCVTLEDVQDRVQQCLETCHCTHVG